MIPTDVLELNRIGAKIIRHARYVTCELAQVAIPCKLFWEILHRIEGFHLNGTVSGTGMSHIRRQDGESGWLGVAVELEVP